LQFTALTGGGLLVNIAHMDTACAANSPANGPQAAAFKPNAFIKIRTDGVVILVAQNPELGQGVKTALPMILADELGANFSTLQIEYGYLDAALGPQEAGGSMSIFDCYQPLREAGATARTLLIRAAAGQWGVPYTTSHPKSHSASENWHRSRQRYPLPARRMLYCVAQPKAHSSVSVSGA
jgi:isoquinoline 1-oxidoreductase beta subunit